jgi:hypothetical protein
VKSKTRSKNSQQPREPIYFLDRQLGAYKLAGILDFATLNWPHFDHYIWPHPNR